MACVSAAVYELGGAKSAPTASSSSPSADLEAQALRLLGRLGDGVQGRVDLAYDDRSKREVAVKWPAFARNDWETIDDQIAALHQESEALQRISHPHVVRLHRVVPGRFKRRGYRALVLEHASHGDLFDLIVASGALPDVVAKAFFHQLVLGVQACHANGVIHRDIKPENLLLDNSFSLKLADFGSASVVTPAWPSAEAALLSGCVDGTLEYMPPEAEGFKPYRATPVDVWACGVVLFIMLTGARPFQQREEGDLSYDAVLRGDAAAFWQSQSSVLPRPSEQAKDLINRLLCANPEDRISVTEILQHPWLHDAAAIDQAHVAEIMQARLADAA